MLVGFSSFPDSAHQMSVLNTECLSPKDTILVLKITWEQLIRKGEVANALPPGLTGNPVSRSGFTKRGKTSDICC